MSYQEAWNALNMRMPSKIPRTEYSANQHWNLVRSVTNISVNSSSCQSKKDYASSLFERSWNYGLTWSIAINSDELSKCRTSMGHAKYAQDGTDYDNSVNCPFSDPEDALKFDPYSAYGTKEQRDLIDKFNQDYYYNQLLHPNQVNMTGIYITLMSGLLEIFGWQILLEAMGTDADKFGEVANRYTDWILQHFEALAKSDSPVVMVHDDIVWTSGKFTHSNWYRKYIFQNYLKLLSPLQQAKKIILFTSDGNYTEFIDDIAACGINGFVLEPSTDMELIATKYGQTHSFIGNADCRVLTYGTKSDIRIEVERCLSIGRDCPGYIFATGNHIPSNVPVENAIYYNEVFEELSYRIRR